MMVNNSFSILSWNSLADCYAHGAFTGRMPNSQTILSWHNRINLILTTLSKQSADVVCLQEVDHFTSHFLPYFQKQNYHTEYLQRPGREDGVLIAFKRSKFTLRKREDIHFDDLATACSSFIPVSHKRRLQKSNVAILLLLETSNTQSIDYSYNKKTIIISTTHLFWNPALPRVKLAQARYLLERIANIRTDIGTLPFASILTGDFNSTPNSKTYASILQGVEIRHPVKVSIQQTVQRALSLYWPYSSKTGKIKFICDANLSRLARWLRLLGVDAALEDDQSQVWRAKNDFTALFERANSENRIIITTSTELVQRAACPEAYLLKQSARSSLKDWLVSVLTFYGVQLDRNKLLSRCGKCGDNVEACSRTDPRLHDKKIPTDRDLFICCNCTQVYWWNESSTSTSTKASKLAESLYTAVQTNRKYLNGNHASHSKFESTDTSNSNPFDVLHENESCPPQHLQTKTCFAPASIPLHYSYRSAFVEVNGKEPSYTNKNGSFRGTLDYIFVCGDVKLSHVNMLERLEENSAQFRKNYFPNESWPSDHMLIRAEITFDSRKRTSPTFVRSNSFTYQ